MVAGQVRVDGLSTVFKKRKTSTFGYEERVNEQGR